MNTPGHSATIHPVIHITSREQAVEQALLARSSGAESVFLIDHQVGGEGFIWSMVDEVRTAVPGLSVGVNHLSGGGPLATLRELGRVLDSGSLREPPSSLWCDDARDGRSDLSEAEAVAELRRSRPDLSGITYFGGVSFKYTRTYSDDPETAAAEATLLAPYVDIVTTSGPGTNQSAGVDKITAMRAALGSHPLGLASGVSPENLHHYRPIVDHVLVASSVETSPYSGEFVPDRLAALFAETPDPH